MRVLLTGATGLIGARLTRELLRRGDSPVVLTRRPEVARKLFGEACEVVAGDPTQAGPWMDVVAGCEGVINLAGENVFARRWNATFKDRLRESRILATRHVAEALKRNPLREDGQPRVLVNASAIGYYGARGDEELTEDSPPGDDFLAGLCVEWERNALEVLAAGVRCVIVRVGIVLDREGGALARLLTPFKLFVGGRVGSGRQWMSWIHHQDMVGIFLHPLDQAEVTGALNGTAPSPATNRDFSRALGRVLHRPTLFPAPILGLRLLLGEVADVVTSGQRVLPVRTLQAGYRFRFPELAGALQDILQQ